MSLGEYARLAVLLGRAATGAGARPHPEVRERRDEVTGAGWHVDRYEPTGKIRGTVCFLHGCTVNGKDDHRLRGFCRSAALAGVRAVVPTIPGLARLTLDTADIDGLCALVSEEHARSGQRVGVVGFSFAGSYGIVAAARPAVADKVRFVLGVGAYHCLQALYDRVLARSALGLPREARDRDAWTYEQLVLAFRHRVALGLPRATADRVRELLASYCEHKGALEAEAFAREYLAPLRLVERDHRTRDPETLARLSPAGQVAGVRCPVGLVHDPDDQAVPADQARALYAELNAGDTAGRHRLVLTRLLSHVDIAAPWRLPELVRLGQVLLPLTAW